METGEDVLLAVLCDEQAKPSQDTYDMSEHRFSFSTDASAETQTATWSGTDVVNEWLIGPEEASLVHARHQVHRTCGGESIA